MRNPMIFPAVLILALTACDSSTISRDTSQSSISIPDAPRDALTQLPQVNFNGQYETTARPELGTSSGGDTDGDGDGGAGGIAVSSPEAASADGSSSRVAGPSTIWPPVNPNPSIEPGTLTAGDYDDQLNPHLYQSYARDYLQRRGQWIDTPRLDLNNRIRIEVTDKTGQPYADAEVELTGTGSQTTKRLRTAANGITSVYTTLDSLTENFTLRVSGANDTSIQQEINLQKAIDAGQINVTLATDRQNQSSSTPVDLMFVIDTTGSMRDELSFLQTELTDIISAVPLQNSDINIGLVFYRDYGDRYVVRAHEFSNDINSVQLNLNQEQASGGGDYPEAMDQAMQTAMGSNWRTDSRKVLFLLADAPPHSDRMRATWTAAEQARSKNIHLVPVAASGVADDAEYIMRSVAALTNSRYLFLTDDSGFGQPHDEPDVDCYVVTSLRNAMIRALNSLVTGVRIEATDNDIVRQVGNYNNGICDPIDPPTATGPVDYSVLVEQQFPLNGTFTDKRTEIIGNQNQLTEELSRYGESSVTVDFTNAQVLLVDMGQRNTGGNSVRIDSFTEYDNYVQANIELLQPARGCLTTQALTNPFVFATVSTQKEIRVSETVVEVCAVP